MRTRWNDVGGKVIVTLALMLGLLVGSHAASAQDVATPPAEALPDDVTPRPAHIHAGTCDELGEVVFPLNDISTVDVDTLDPLGAAGQSLSTIEASLEDVLATEHAINVHESAENIDEYIACGELVGEVTDGGLIVELEELNASGFTGEAVLEDVGDGTTTVSVVLTAAEAEPIDALGATPAPAATPVAAADAFAVGTVLVTIEENLRVRTEPGTEAEIITALPTGSELQVLGGPEEADGFTWYEVEAIVDAADPVSGWIASDFVEPVLEAEE
jgi:hypothetical protein